MQRNFIMTLVLVGALSVVLAASHASASIILSSFIRSTGGAVVTEGETVTLTANLFSDAGTITAGSATISADTSSSDTQPTPYSQGFNIAGSTSASVGLTTTYRDDGFATARVSGSGYWVGGANSFTRTLNFSVLNVNPSLTSYQLLSDPAATYFEGSTTGMRFEATDPGFFDDLTFIVNGRIAATHTTDTLNPRIILQGVPLFQQGFVTLVQLVAQARDKDGAFSNSIVGPTIRIFNLSPTIRSATADTSTAPDALFSFSASADDPGFDPLTYQWDLDDDGQFDDFTGSSGQHSFTSFGTHRISVRVHDDGGGISTPRSLIINVVPEPSSLALAAVGAVAALVGLLRRKRRR